MKNIEEFKKRIDNATANIVDVTNFNDEYIKMIQKKEQTLGIVLTVKDQEGRMACLCQGETTGTLFVEYIEDGGMFRL